MLEAGYLGRRLGQDRIDSALPPPGLLTGSLGTTGAAKLTPLSRWPAIRRRASAVVDLWTVDGGGPWTVDLARWTTVLASCSRSHNQPSVYCTAYCTYCLGSAVSPSLFSLCILDTKPAAPLVRTALSRLQSGLPLHTVLRLLPLHQRPSLLQPSSPGPPSPSSPPSAPVPASALPTLELHLVHLPFVAHGSLGTRDHAHGFLFLPARLLHFPSPTQVRLCDRYDAAL